MLSQKGFTLLELVIGIAISSFVLAATFLMLNNGLLIQKHNFAQERIFNEGRKTVAAVSNELRQSTITNVSADGQILTYTTHASKGAKTKQIIIDSTNHALYIDDLSQAPALRTAYATGLLDAASQFTQSNSIVELSLHLVSNTNATSQTTFFNTMIMTGPLL